MNRSLFPILFAILLIACETKQEDTRFNLLSAKTTGIDFTNSVIEKDSFNILHNEYMYNGAGVGIGDLNNDGLSDLILCGNKVNTSIYLNEGDWRFKDVSSALIDMDDDVWVSGVNVVDINGDGWQDIYFSITQGNNGSERKNQLWINQGANGKDLKFTEQADQWGIADSSHSVHSTFFDADLDGDLDLYILNNIINKQTPTVYRPKITDGSAANSDNFYINNGDGTFSQDNEKAGITMEGFGLGIAVSDFNKDNYPDLYISNDYVSNDIMYLNQGDGTFKNEIAEYVSCQSRFSMGNDVVDLNNDSYPEIITLDMLPKSRQRVQQTISSYNYTIYLNDSRFGYERQYSRNMLHTHNGLIGDKMTRFSEVAQLANISATEWSWSALGADYNNDGKKDLIITNGFPKDVTDKDFANYKAAVYGFLAGDEEMLRIIPEVKVENFAFEQEDDNFSFKDVTKEWGMDIPSFSNGAAYVDLDNDGDLDYVCSNINDPLFVFRNNTVEREKESANYLRIKLIGNSPNTMAIGAKVKIYTTKGQQYYEHYLSRGYLSSVDPVIHFGLENLSQVDSMVIIWPGGRSSTKLQDISSNQVLTIDESSSEAIGPKEKITPTTYFEDVSMTNTYKHEQLDFIDFFQPQRTLQHKYSQIGPVLSIADIDGNGVNELLAGTNNNQKFEIYHIGPKGLTKGQFSGIDIPPNYNSGAINVFDAENDGDQDILVTGGGYEYDDSTSYLHFLFRQSANGDFTREVLPLPPFVSGIIECADVDKDNDMDFFIGRRVDRLQFPQSGSSYLVINNNGSFSSENVIPIEAGMVTDAQWADLDGDGWTDLIVTSEWDQPKIFYNKSGSLSMEPSILGNNLKGAWQSIKADDIDNDGDIDLVLGNIGANITFDVSDNTPLRLYTLDIDNNGVLDPIFTAFWQDEDGNHREYPIHFWDELIGQSPFFRNRFESYAEYGTATINSIFQNKEEVDVLEITSVNSGVLWNDDGTFSWSPFARPIQNAPIREILIHDFTDDKTKDILLLGNDYSYTAYTGEFDANRGTLLKGKGDHTFELVPQNKSGLNIKGQVEFAKITKIEGNSHLIIGINRDELEMYRIKDL